MDEILVLGVVTGMRSMTAIAALAWVAWLGLVPEHGWATWIAHLVVAVIFTLCAVGEYVVDTRPNTPKRTELGPAVLRVIIGSAVGAMIAVAIDEPVAGGIIFGAGGAIIGTWGGFFVRMTVARIFRRDLPAALLESASAIGLTIREVAKLHHGILLDMQRALR